MLKRENFAIETIYVTVKRKGHARSEARRGDRTKYAGGWPDNANPATAGRRAFCADRRSTSAGSRKGVGRADDRRLSCRRTKALNQITRAVRQPLATFG